MTSFDDRRADGTGAITERLRVRPSQTCAMLPASGVANRPPAPCDIAMMLRRCPKGMPAVALQPATWDAVAVGTGAAILIVVTGKCNVQVPSAASLRRTRAIIAD